MAIRFHLDEHISPIVAEILRRHGIDVSTSQEAGLLGEPDDTQLAFADREGRTLATCDSDMTLYDVISRARHGVCFCHRNKYSIPELAEALRIVAECMIEDEMRGHLEYL